MLILGHLGIGSQISRLFSRDLPLPWVLLGCALPDLIDKSLYYGFREVLPWASSTRTIGHTGLLLLAIVLVSVLSGSRKMLAVGLGVLTHLMLDVAGDRFELFDGSAIARAVLFPFLGPFNFENHGGIGNQVAHKVRDYYVVVAEGVGFLLLLWGYRPIRLRLRRAIRRLPRS